MEKNQNYKENCEVLLKIITGKNKIIFTTRGNDSIKKSLNLIKELGKSICLMQDEGGWMYYQKFIEQAGLETIRLVTTNGLIHEKELKYHEHDSALLLNSLAGYFNMHNMNNVYASCIQNDCFLINDISGSIGSKEAMIGDVLIGSFGEGKPIDMGHGGFIAFNEEDEFNIEDDNVELDFNKLEKKLLNLSKRREFLKKECKKVIDDLKEFNILNKRDGTDEGLVVIVKFKNEEEKNKIIKYCDDNDYEYTICPREIRIMDDAISIEIKRMSYFEDLK
jgi:hypothetical protein